MTLRRLHLLISGLPPESLAWAEMEAARKRALVPTVDKIRERAEHYKRQRERAATDG